MNAQHPLPPGAPVAAYLRDSGGEEQELSLAQQETEIRAWCQAHGLPFTRIFRDEARPGSSAAWPTAGVAARPFTAMSPLAPAGS